MSAYEQITLDVMSSYNCIVCVGDKHTTGNVIPVELVYRCYGSNINSKKSVCLSCFISLYYVTIIHFVCNRNLVELYRSEIMHSFLESPLCSSCAGIGKRHLCSCLSSQHLPPPPPPPPHHSSFICDRTSSFSKVIHIDVFRPP